MERSAFLVQVPPQQGLFSGIAQRPSLPEALCALYEACDAPSTFSMTSVFFLILFQGHDEMFCHDHC